MLSSLSQCSNDLDRTVTPPRYRLAIHDLLVNDCVAHPEHIEDWAGHITTPSGGYRPVPQALRFHQSESRFRWALGGNRSSKSHALCHEVYWHATGTHPFLPSKGGCQVWYATPTFELVGAIVWPKLKRLIGNNCTISWYNRAEDIPRSITIPTKDGPSKITFKAYEQGREVFQGTEMSFVAFDEQCPQDVFIEATSRIGANVTLKFAAALTPIDPQPWLEELLTSEKPDNWDVFEFPLDDNRISAGGFIDDAQIDAMIEMWPPEVRPTRRRGKWGSFLGTVYQTFSREIHVVSEELERRAFMRNGKIPGDEVIGSIDWGGSNPFVFLWLAKIPHLDNDFYVFDEYYWPPRERGARRLEEHADEIKARSAHWDVMLARTWADHDPTDANEFYHLGVPSQPAEKDRRPGIEAMRAMLNPRPALTNPDWPMGRPRLHIAARCENTIREHAAYKWKPGTERQDAPDEPMKVNDHTCFPAGQLADTPNGPRPIESLRKGDQVFSHLGVATVDAGATITGEKELIELEMADGRVIMCTADHPLLSHNGWIEAKDALWAQLLSLPTTSELLIGATGSTSLNMVDSFGVDTRTAHMRRSANTSAEASVGVGSCGTIGYIRKCFPNSTETFPPGTSSITRTKTRETMSRGTLKRRPHPNTPLTIHPISQRPLRRRGDGMGPQLGWHGTPSMVGSAGNIASPSQKPAIIAEISSPPLRGEIPDSVQANAGHMQGEHRGSITSNVHVLFAAKNLALTATTRRSLAPQNVERVGIVRLRKLAGKHVVYNLSTSDGTFCVNGIVASNCDALRYIIFGERAYEPLNAGSSVTHGRYRKTFQ